MAFHERVCNVFVGNMNVQARSNNHAKRVLYPVTSFNRGIDSNLRFGCVWYNRLQPILTMAEFRA